MGGNMKKNENGKIDNFNEKGTNNIIFVRRWPLFKIES